MKTIKNTTRYRCDHCDKEYKIANYCIKHEVKCTANPANSFACTNCEFLAEVTKDVETDEYPYGFTAKAFFCTKKNIGLYPPKVIHNGLLTQFPDAFKGEERMPVECSDFKFDPPF